MSALSLPSLSQVTNGNFSSGTLSGWTSFVTANGTANAGGAPDVQSFDVTGGGASQSAHFNVGEVTFTGVLEGGGIFQSIVFGAAGTALFSADIASHQSSRFSNAAGGNFEMLLDGGVIDSFDMGAIGSGATLRHSLSASQAVTAGSHELRFRITRPFITSVNTPDQYIDNVVASGPTGSVVPEPSSAVLLLAGGLPLAGILIRRRKS